MGRRPLATRAAFFLQAGLRSLVGGNVPAAAARLQACHHELAEQVVP